MIDAAKDQDDVEGNAIMPISEWNRNTSLLALQLSADYLLGMDTTAPDVDDHTVSRASTSIHLFGGAASLGPVAATAHGRKAPARPSRFKPADPQ